MARQRWWKLSVGKIRELNAVAIFLPSAIHARAHARIYIYVCVYTYIHHKSEPAVPYVSCSATIYFRCVTFARARERIRAQISSARTTINCASTIIVIRTCSRHSTDYLSPADCENDRNPPHKVVNRDFRRCAIVKGNKQHFAHARRTKQCNLCI